MRHHSGRQPPPGRPGSVITVDNMLLRDNSILHRELKLVSDEELEEFEDWEITLLRVL